MKRFVLLISLILIFTMLCSCTNKYDIVFEEVVEEKEESNTHVSETSNIDKIDIKFTAEIPSEEFLTSTKDYHSFASTLQDYVPVHYKTNHTVNNVELFKIRLDAGDRFMKDEVVYTLEKLSPDKHLVASTLIVGTIPQMAISFSDDDGNTYVYSVNTSGKDGSIVLDEIELVVSETSN